MKAAMFHGRRDIRLEEVRPPTISNPHELLLDVDTASLCGTDLGEYVHGPIQVPLAARHPGSGHVGPTILGHEFVGRVAAVGDRVEGFSIGQRVISGAGVSCNDCAWCRIGRTNLCARYYTIGLNTHGGLADQVVVPEQTCFAVPPECSAEAAVLAQPLAVALHAAGRARIATGDTVLVVGAGAIGSLLVSAAVVRGAAEVIAVDVDDRRLAVAKALGATRTVRSASELELNPGTPTIVIEATGTEAGLAMALQSVGRGGRVLLVGLHDSPVPVDLLPLILNEVEITTTNAHICATDLPEAIRVLSSHDLATHVVGRTIPLEHVITEGFEAIVNRRVSGKVVVSVANGR